MNNPRPVVRIMADIVQATSDAVLSTIQEAELLQVQASDPDAVVSNISVINYQFGHLKEIIATMKDLEKSPEERYNKYPLIALLLDFPESMGNSGGYVGDVTLQLIIAYCTESGLKAEQRYSQVFEPILLPIYYELLNQIECSGEFVTQGANRIKHTKTDHPFYGKGSLTDTSSNVFPDFVDCIEISNLQLRLNFSNCY